MTLTPDRIRRLVEAARKSPPVEFLASGRTLRKHPVRALPDWVSACYVRTSEEGQHWILCEPGPDPVGPASGSQFVFDIPPGRYMVDVFDTETGQCLAHESAASSPIVAAVSTPAAAVLVHLYPVP